MRDASALGWMEGSAHVFPVRVYWEDTDAFGIVYYANYLRYIERARSDLLRLAGVDQIALLAETGLGFAVRHCAIDYLRPARLDDSMAVRTELTDGRGATLTAKQAVWRGDEELVTADVRLACLDRGGRPRRVPPDVLERLATLSPSLLGKPAA